MWTALFAHFAILAMSGVYFALAPFLSRLNSDIEQTTLLLQNSSLPALDRQIASERLADLLVQRYNFLNGG
tara:strand:- start:332 stop:544 length:213 start_codon:yes stop_codon:yes gene_type:complete